MRRASGGVLVHPDSIAFDGIITEETLFTMAALGFIDAALTRSWSENRPLLPDW